MSYQKPGAYNCRICARSLDVRSDDQGNIVEFTHTGATLDKDQPTHEPDPVPLEELDLPNFLCDFCLVDGARWYLPVADHVFGLDPDGTIHRDVSGWAACDVCAIALRHDNWDLITHRVAYGNARNGKVAAWWIWKQMMDDLRPYITGPVRLYTKGDIK